MAFRVAAIALLVVAASLHLAAAAREPREEAQAVHAWASKNGALYTPWACGVIAEGFEIVPGSDWGSTTGEVQQKWTDSNCDLKICAHFVGKYGVVPGKSWGSLPSKLVPGWSWERPNGKGNCDSLWATGAAGVTSSNEAASNAAVYQAWGCGVIATGYQLVPGSDWGSTPSTVMTKWTDSACDNKICAFYVSKYGVVPGQHLGTLPSELQKAWSWDRPGGVGNCEALWQTAL